MDAAAFGGAAAVSGLQENIDQKFVFVGGRGEQGKVMAVRSLLKEGILPPVLLFVQTKERAAELFRELVYGGMRVDAIHADRSDAARRSAVARFRTGKIWMLIATDVLARGLDFLAVNTVINYDMPSSGTAYVHRIGRTGRNGRRGKAITFFTEEDQRVVAGVVKVAKASGAELPDWLVALAARVRKDEERRLESRPPVRNRIGGPNRASLRRGRKRKGGAHEGDVKGERDADADGDEGEDRDEKGDGVNEARSKRVRGEKYDDLGDNDSKNGSCEVGKQQKEKKKRKRKD